MDSADQVSRDATTVPVLTWQVGVKRKHVSFPMGSVILATAHVADPCLSVPLVPETMYTVKGLGEAETCVLAVEYEHEDFVQGDSTPEVVYSECELVNPDDVDLPEFMTQKSLDDFSFLKAEIMSLFATCLLPSRLGQGLDIFPGKPLVQVLLPRKEHAMMGSLYRLVFFCIVRCNVYCVALQAATLSNLILTRRVSVFEVLACQ